MRTLRGWLFYAAFAVTMVPVALVILLTAPVKDAAWRYDAVVRPWLGFVMKLLKFFCGITYEVTGAENIPQDGRSVVVLSKHSSAWETLFLPYFVPHRMGFVYKESLHRIPFFGWALKSMGMIAINRQKGVSAYASFLRRGREFLKSGWWVILFPEGTRVAWKTQKPYKTGGARFAVATGAWVLPVAHDAGRLWPRNTVAKTPGVIHVVFGPLIKTEGETFQTIHQATQSWIEREVARMVEADA